MMSGTAICGDGLPLLLMIFLQEECDWGLRMTDPPGPITSLSLPTPSPSFPKALNLEALELDQVRAAGEEG